MNRAVFVETPDVERALRSSALAGGTALVASSRERVVEVLRQKGIEAVWTGEDTPAGEIRAAEETAYATARGWSSEPGIRAALAYRGVDLGACVQLSFGSYLARTFGDWTRLRCFVEAHAVREALVLRAPAVAPKSFYPDPPETDIPALLRAAGVRVSEETVRSSPPRANAPRALFKSFAKGFLPAFTPPRRTDGRSVLFCGALKQLEGVLAASSSEGPVTVLDREAQIATRARLASRYGAGYLRFDSWIAADRRSPERSRYMREFGRAWPSLLERLRSSRGRDLLGANVFALAAPRLAWFDEEKVAELAAWIDGFHKLFDRQDIGALVLNEDVLEFHRTLASVARERGVPSLVLLHATTPSFCRGFDLVPLTAERIAVGGEGLKADCERWGIPADRIHVTGVPRYEPLARLDPDACRKELAALCGFTADRPIITFAATYHNDRFDPRGDRRDIRSAYEDLFAALSRAAGGCQLFIKLYHHLASPEEEIDVRPLAQGAGVKVFFDARFELLRALAGSDLCVTFPSGAVTEAALLGKPFIVLDHLSRIRGFEPLARLAPGCLAGDRAALERSLERFFAKDPAWMAAAAEATRRVAAEWAGPVEGSASRIAGLVREMVSARSPEKAVAR